jgi:hypothetical protein
MKMKFCKDCKFAKPHVTKTFSLLFGAHVRRDFEFAKCTNLQVIDAPNMGRWSSMSEYLVTGEGGPLCSIARRDAAVCGPDATHFEAANG